MTYNYCLKRSRVSAGALKLLKLRFEAAKAEATKKQSPPDVTPPIPDPLRKITVRPVTTKPPALDGLTWTQADSHGLQNGPECATLFGLKSMTPDANGLYWTVAILRTLCYMGESDRQRTQKPARAPWNEPARIRQDSEGFAHDGPAWRAARPFSNTCPAH